MRQRLGRRLATARLPARGPARRRDRRAGNGGLDLEYRRMPCGDPTRVPIGHLRPVEDPSHFRDGRDGRARCARLQQIGPGSRSRLPGPGGRQSRDRRLTACPVRGCRPAGPVARWGIPPRSAALKKFRTSPNACDRVPHLPRAEICYGRSTATLLRSLPQCGGQSISIARSC